MAREFRAPVRSNGFLERDLRHPLLFLHREVNRLFDVFHDSVGAPEQGGSRHDPIMPSIDVSETEQEMRIRVDLPGMNAGDIDVSLVDDILTVRGEKKLDKADDAESYYLVERSHGTFLRSVRLPYVVDTEDVRADFANGVLTVTLRKCKDKERSRRIPVRDGQTVGDTRSLPEQSPQHDRSGGGNPNK